MSLTLMQRRKTSCAQRDGMGLQPVTVGPMPCIGSTDKRIYIFFNSIQFIYLRLKLTHTCIQLIIKMQTHVYIYS